MMSKGLGGEHLNFSLDPMSSPGDKEGEGLVSSSLTLRAFPETMTSRDVLREEQRGGVYSSVYSSMNGYHHSGVLDMRTKNSVSSALGLIQYWHQPSAGRAVAFSRAEGAARKLLLEYLQEVIDAEKRRPAEMAKVLEAEEAKFLFDMCVADEREHVEAMLKRPIKLPGGQVPTGPGKRTKAAADAGKHGHKKKEKKEMEKEPDYDAATVSVVKEKKVLHPDELAKMTRQIATVYEGQYREAHYGASPTKEETEQFIRRTLRERGIDYENSLRDDELERQAQKERLQMKLKEAADRAAAAAAFIQLSQEQKYAELKAKIMTRAERIEQIRQEVTGALGRPGMNHPLRKSAASASVVQAIDEMAGPSKEELCPASEDGTLKLLFLNAEEDEAGPPLNGFLKNAEEGPPHDGGPRARGSPHSTQSDPPVPRPRADRTELEQLRAQAIARKRVEVGEREDLRALLAERLRQRCEELDFLYEHEVRPYQSEKLRHLARRVQLEAQLALDGEYLRDLHKDVVCEFGRHTKDFLRKYEGDVVDFGDVGEQDEAEGGGAGQRDRGRRVWGSSLLMMGGGVEEQLSESTDETSDVTALLNEEDEHWREELEAQLEDQDSTINDRDDMIVVEQADYHKRRRTANGDKLHQLLSRDRSSLTLCSGRNSLSRRPWRLVDNVWRNTGSVLHKVLQWGAEYRWIDKIHLSEHMMNILKDCPFLLKGNALSSSPRAEHLGPQILAGLQKKGRAGGQRPQINIASSNFNLNTNNPYEEDEYVDEATRLREFLSRDIEAEEAALNSKAETAIARPQHKGAHFFDGSAFQNAASTHFAVHMVGADNMILSSTGTPQQRTNTEVGEFARAGGAHAHAPAHLQVQPQEEAAVYGASRQQLTETAASRLVELLETVTQGDSVTLAMVPEGGHQAQAAEGEAEADGMIRQEARLEAFQSFLLEVEREMARVALLAGPEAAVERMRAALQHFTT
eukprot:g2235.t1